MQHSDKILININTNIYPLLDETSGIAEKYELYFESCLFW